MGELFSIQYLRGIAATLVVIYHLGPALERLGWTGGWRNNLSAGVDVFFVISGFIMWHTTRANPPAPLTFWRKRLVRIVPLYWVLTTLMVVIVAVAPAVVNSARLVPGHVLASYLFIGVPNPGKPVVEPLVYPGWTLNYEMLFYLLFGLGLRLPPRGRFALVAGTFALLVLAGQVLHPPELSSAGFYTRPQILEFVLGMVLAEADHARAGQPLLSCGLGWPMVVVGLAGLLAVAYPLEADPFAHYAVPALVLVAGALQLEREGRLGQWPLLRRLGDASYSIYLGQLLAMAAFLVVWRKLGLHPGVANWVLFCVSDVAVALGFGLALHRLVERPLTRWLTRRLAGTAPRPRPESA